MESSSIGEPHAHLLPIPRLYKTLGLLEPTSATTTRRNPITQFPPLLLILSTHLEQLVRTNEKLLQSQTPEKITVFHGLRPPNLTIHRYVERIFKYSNCSPACFVLAQVYIDRFLLQPNVHLTSRNVHRLLITCVSVAAKFIDDAFYNNAYYARVGGITTVELNKMELSLLFCLDFRVQVTTETFGLYCKELEEEGNRNNYKVEGAIVPLFEGLKITDNKEDSDSKFPIQSGFPCKSPV